MCQEKEKENSLSYKDNIKNCQERLITVASQSTGKQREKQQKLGNRNLKISTVWIFQATNGRDCSQEDLDMATKRKSLEIM